MPPASDSPPGSEEKNLRQEMNSFTSMHTLRVGDVISIPTYTPHALQHGVRAIEFQTPHYERQILSFAQKVLTQSDWDTESAIANAVITSEPASTHLIICIVCLIDAAST